MEVQIKKLVHVVRQSLKKYDVHRLCDSTDREEEESDSTNREGKEDSKSESEMEI